MITCVGLETKSAVVRHPFQARRATGVFGPVLSERNRRVPHCIPRVELLRLGSGLSRCIATDTGKEFVGVAVVSGASRGIGRGIATKLVQKQYQVALMSRSDRCVKTCHELRSALPIAEGQVVPFQCDVSSEDQVHETVRSIVSHFGKIDALVNAAGVSIDRLVLKTTKADLLEIFGTNTFGSLYMAKAASRYMIKEKKGSIVFIGSIVGVTGGVGQIAYASSKSALIGATKTLSLELAQYGIRTNLVSLGFVHTDMTAHVPEFTKEKYRMQTPGQRFSTVEEASQVVLKVLEDREMNGRHVLVNGDLVSFL